jgi:hypothetical protein
MSPTRTKGEVVYMADHRQYVTTDNWQTAALIERDGTVRQLTDTDLDFARFLAVAQSSWQGDAS